jgi:hypothetical protein
MSIFNKLWVWFQQVKMLPTNLAKVAEINKYLECQQELAKTQNRLKEVEQQLAADTTIKIGRMFFRNNVYWAKNEDGKIEESPYCPRCFELGGKLVHLITWQTRWNKVAKCPECKVDEILFGELN